MHAGRQSALNGPSYAASALPGALSARIPFSLGTDQIEMIIDDFGDAAMRAHRAGIRMLELHAAHGYLLSDFLSPSLNSRTDLYGGTLENRFRFLQQTMERILQIPGISVGVRLNGKENIDGGMTEEDLIYLVDRIQGAGASYISISAGVYSQNDIIMPDRQDGEVVLRRQGQIAKTMARVPVMLAGNITTVQSANEMIISKATDVALMGRALLANPDLLEQHEAGVLQPNPCCTMKRVCKYNSRRLPQISCPHNKLLMSQLISRLRTEGRMPATHEEPHHV
jgi:2,4-dienoyl-CoA reductase-like NADH-dependent reductase (Old Yellow Enzyme family)